MRVYVKIKLSYGGVLSLLKKSRPDLVGNDFTKSTSMTSAKKQIIFLSIFLFSAVFGNLPDAMAEESMGVKMSPSIIEERADPGQTYSWTLRATNVGVKTQQLYVVKRDISGLSEEGKPNFANFGKKPD